MISGLTKRQSDVLAFIDAYIREHGYSPSYQEIADAIGFASKGRVWDVIDDLEQRGRIRRSAGRSRSIEVVGGYDFHLKRILDAVQCSGFIGRDDPIIVAAREAVDRP